MKVLLANAPRDLRVVEMETPTPGPREVLVKVKHFGVCATDISIANGTLRLGEGLEPIYPVRLGHEWSGVVEAVGSETRRFHPGDPVISETAYSCGECEECLSGQYHRCAEGRAIGTIGNCWPGAMAEYMVVPERLTFRVPKNVPLDEAALVEPSSIGLYGLVRAPIGPGTNLLVIGTGPIGLGGMACSKGMGTGKTILAGRKERKLAIGKEMGADILVNMTEENLFDVVMRETNGIGMDVVMDTTGAAELLNDSLYLLRGSGFLVIPGFYEQELNHVKLDRLIARNCTLVGSAGMPNIGPKVLDLLSSGHTRLKPMITDRFPFSQVLDAFRAVEERNDSRVKIMVDFE
ncbi:MAG: alcohol dehydrogenase catalytic domain-containing protein [Clostridia bacterium]|nr:alcohol dehydrogenase catalytic domain-containing protein [Clostridia bacterium]